MFQRRFLPIASPYIPEDIHFHTVYTAIPRLLSYSHS
jgi:hypothetical protein